MQKTYCPDEAFTLELTGIDGQPLFNDDGSAMTLQLLGGDSDIAVKARNASATRRLQSGGRKLTGEDLDADNTSYLAKLTVGWNLTPSKLVPGVDPGLGEGKVDFTPGGISKIYGNPKLSVIKDQADTGIGTRANFMKASQSN